MGVENKAILSADEVRAEVANLDGWDYLPETKELRRVWQFEKFVPTMIFVRTLTDVMDKNNHHSDLNLDSRKKTLTVTVTTHSENAITRADVDFAKAVNAIS